MFESRCGVCCNQCKRKDEVHCTGCIKMKKPFWGGQCGVKSCCEGNQLDHCGKCIDFPCEMLSTMGVEQGFNPTPKIEQCKKWTKE
ncbi:DUF3795 domain-containing protein [Clostridium sp. CH2]|uniref:DUF3795 domain-containing protein n=1 Tax=Clostridium sp. CH2 TaxID=2949990 RepID=UPI00207A617D|nr:DUF3795 domain-containing protein [Clostridium sp. CH2]